MKKISRGEYSGFPFSARLNAQLQDQREYFPNFVIKKNYTSSARKNMYSMGVSMKIKL